MMKREKEEIRSGDGNEAVFPMTNAASGTECTGLIQVPPESEDEMENYAEVYRFAPSKPLAEGIDTRNPAKNLKVPKRK